MTSPPDLPESSSNAPSTDISDALPVPAGSDRPIIWINAGETSGDLHGATLMKAFRELGADYEFRGMGGTAMAEMGMEPDLDSGALSLVGLTEVFAHLPKIVGLLRRTKELLRKLRPAAVILIDSPAYNFRIAKIAASLKIPVYYYISPQIWAWRKNRVFFLKKYTRRVLCILPFETKFYEDSGVAAHFVGHPLVDHMKLESLCRIEPEPGLVGILPGSRRKEIASLLPVFAEAARVMYGRDPNLKFSIFRAPGVEESTLRSRWPDELPFEIVEPGERYEEMRRAQVLLAASGTVTLEAALLETPLVAAYKVAPLTFFVGLFFIDVPFITLPNLILNRRVYPELLQKQASPEHIARMALGLIHDPDKLAAVRSELVRLKELMGGPGAPERAARVILDDLRDFYAG